MPVSAGQHHIDGHILFDHQQKHGCTVLASGKGDSMEIALYVLLSVSVHTSAPFQGRAFHCSIASRPRRGHTTAHPPHSGICRSLLPWTLYKSRCGSRRTCWGIGWRPHPVPCGRAVFGGWYWPCGSNRCSGIKCRPPYSKGVWSIHWVPPVQKFTPPCVQRTESGVCTVLQEEYALIMSSALSISH